MKTFLNRYFKHGDQKKLAQRSGLAETILWSWKTGRTTPKLSTAKWLIIAMSEYYEVDEKVLWNELYNCV